MNKDELKEALAVANTKLEANAKTIENLELNLRYANERATDLQNQVEMMHSVLDGVAGAPGRTIKDDNEYSGKRELNIAARFTGFCASLVHRQFPPNALTATRVELTQEG